MLILEYLKYPNSVFKQMSKRFNANLLYLNIGKTDVMQFQTKNDSHSEVNIIYNNKTISNTSNLKFIVLLIEHNVLEKIILRKLFLN